MYVIENFEARKRELLNRKGKRYQFEFELFDLDWREFL